MARDGSLSNIFILCTLGACNPALYFLFHSDCGKFQVKEILCLFSVKFPTDFKILLAGSYSCTCLRRKSKGHQVEESFLCPG